MNAAPANPSGTGVRLLFVTDVCPWPATNGGLLRQGRLLFVGSLDYAPNRDAVLHFVRDIFPLVRARAPGATFHVVGRNPDPAVAALDDGGAVRVHGGVPDLDPHYREAAVVVSSIRLGSGTKLKVLEALLRRKALVATAASAEGIDVRPGVDYERADTPAAFAAACARLLADPAARARLTRDGRDRVARKYSWDAIGVEARRAVAVPTGAAAGGAA